MVCWNEMKSVSLGKVNLPIILTRFAGWWCVMVFGGPPWWWATTILVAAGLLSIWRCSRPKAYARTWGWWDIFSRQFFLLKYFSTHFNHIQTKKFILNSLWVDLSIVSIFWMMHYNSWTWTGNAELKTLFSRSLSRTNKPFLSLQPPTPYHSLIDLYALPLALSHTQSLAHTRISFDSSSVTRKKSPIIYKSCPKMISLEIW